MSSSDDPCPSPSFLEAYLSSDVAKIKNTAILIEVLTVISALNLNTGQRWGFLTSALISLLKVSHFDLSLLLPVFFAFA